MPAPTTHTSTWAGSRERALEPGLHSSGSSRRQSSPVHAHHPGAETCRSGTSSSDAAHGSMINSWCGRKHEEPAAARTGSLTAGCRTPRSPGAAVRYDDARLGVCAGFDRCHVKARVDVDGDGDRDPVGLAIKGTYRNRVIVVRVRTERTHIASRRFDVDYWGHESLWQGTAQLDGRPGPRSSPTRWVATSSLPGVTWRGDGLRPAGGTRPWSLLDDRRQSGLRLAGNVDLIAAGLIRQRVACRVGDTGAPSRERS